MSRNPKTITPDDDLAAAHAMRLPVVKDEKLVGILTDRDLREHSGVLERTKVSTAMTKNLMPVAPRATFEQAAKLMLSHKISGLPALDGGKLVGIVTTSDVVQAFLDMMGASEEGSSRLDFLLEGSHDLVLASKTIAEAGGEVLGVGTYKETWEESRVCYMHLRATDPNRLADVLKEKGYTVLGYTSEQGRCLNQRREKLKPGRSVFPEPRTQQGTVREMSSRSSRPVYRTANGSKEVCPV